MLKIKTNAEMPLLSQVPRWILLLHLFWMEYLGITGAYFLQVGWLVG